MPHHGLVCNTDKIDDSDLSVAFADEMSGSEDVLPIIYLLIVFI